MTLLIDNFRLAIGYVVVGSTIGNGTIVWFVVSS